MVPATDGYLPHVRREPIQWVCILIPDVDMWRMERNPSYLVDLAHIKGMFLEKGAGWHRRYREKCQQKEEQSITHSTGAVSMGEHHCWAGKVEKGRNFGKKKEIWREAAITAKHYSFIFYLAFPIVNPLRSVNKLCDDVHCYLSFS